MILNQNKKIVALTSFVVVSIFVFSGLFFVLKPGGTDLGKKAQGANDTATKSLLHFNGPNGSTTFTDSAITPHIWTASGGAQISTSDYKFGGASGHFTAATTSIISTPDSQDYALGTNDFTIDFWVKRDSLCDASNTMHVLGQVGSLGNNAVTSFRFTFRTSTDNHIGNFVVASGSTSYVATTTTQFTDLNRWYHIAGVRYGNTLTVYVDGKAEGVVNLPNISINDSNGSLTLGRGGDYINALRNFNGYIDEFRFTNGIARWTSNFTPPTSEYSVLNTAPTATTPSSITQAADGSGNITFQTTVSEIENENTQLRVEYSDDDGSNWYPAQISFASANQGSVNYDGIGYQVGSSNPIDTSLGDIILNISWDTKSPLNPTSLDEIDQNNIRIRVIPNDFSEDGLPAVSSAFRLDNQSPTTTITSKPDASTTSTIATFEFGANETATFECKLEASGTYAPCTSPKTYESLAIGSYSFFVRATDGFGNIETSPQTYNWTITASGDGQPINLPPPPSYSPSPEPTKIETSVPSNTLSPAGGTIKYGGVNITLQPNAVLKNTLITINKMNLAPKTLDEKVFVSGANIVASDYSSGTLIKNLSGIAEITFEYSNDNIVDLEESSLGIYYFNELTQSYEKLATVVDRENNAATAKTSHFSIFILWGDKKVPVTPSEPEKIEESIPQQSPASNTTIQNFYQYPEPVKDKETIEKEPKEAEIPTKPVENIQKIYYDVRVDIGWVAVFILTIILLFVLGFIAYQIYKLRESKRTKNIFFENETKISSF